MLPSNEGRGYVLRRIMRRAMRHAQLLGAAEPLMWRLVPALVREMGQAYPELVRGEALITETLKLEERRFRKTLARGLEPARPRRPSSSAQGDRLDGETAFKLYDTYGFPLDLTQDALRQRGITVDTDGFNAAMERQKAEARASWAGSGDAATETVWFTVRDKTGATEFLGYETEKAEGIVAAIVRDGQVVDEAKEGETVGIVVNQTPFYGESGGQMGDTGTISGEGFRIEVTDTQKKADGLFVHQGTVVKGTVKTGAAVELEVDHARRTRLRANHSATHLVHEALREVLGTHVAQKGSLVAPGAAALRLLAHQADHGRRAGRSREDRQRDRRAERAGHDAADVGRRRHRRRRDGAVRREIWRRGPRRLDGHRAAWRQGQQALFGRALRRHACPRDRRHRPRAHRLRSAVAAGVRRIEALTGEAARRHLDEQDKRLKAIASALKVSPADAPARVEALVEERRKLERELSEAKKKLALGGGSSTAAGNGSETVAGVGFIGRTRQRRVAEGPEAARRRRQEEPRLGRRRLRRLGRGRQGERGRRRHRRPDAAFQRRRSRAQGLRRARRAGRRRPAGHGAGRRP